MEKLRSTITPMTAAAIMEPLEDLLAEGGVCQWTNVATAGAEIRRRIADVIAEMQDENKRLRDALNKAVSRGCDHCADTIREARAEAGK